MDDEQTRHAEILSRAGATSPSVPLPGAEGRRAGAAWVSADAYAAACRDDREWAAELLGAAGALLFRDTASFIHHLVLRDRVVQPRLDPTVFAVAGARAAERGLTAILDDPGV